MAEKENVARLMKKIWICDGVISSAAFNLRPQIRETYISVLRECVDTFDNINIKSHAGIFITINGQQLVGGEPFESLEIKRGMSADCVLLEIRKAIAKLASKNIKKFG